MNGLQAEQNLAVIRTLMERSAVYRRALGPIFMVVGGIGVATAVIGLFCDLGADNSALLWGAAALISVVVVLIMTRRQAIHDREPFWSLPTRRVAVAFLPPALVGLALCGLPAWHQGLDAITLCSAAVELTIFYGCSLHSVGVLAPRAVRWLGWIFMLAGFGFLLLLLCEDHHIFRETRSIHYYMGATFGGLHLLGGLVLKFTQKGSNVA